MRRFIGLTLIIIICFILQTTVFQVLALANVVPNLLVIITVAVGYMRGENEAIFTGLGCGLLIDCMFGDVIGLYALIFIIIGFLNGFSNKIYYRDDFTIPLILVGVSDLAYNFLYYVFEFLLRNRQSFPFYFIRVMIPELIYTVLISIFLYKLLHTLNGLLERSESKEA